MAISVSERIRFFESDARPTSRGFESRKESNLAGDTYVTDYECSLQMACTNVLSAAISGAEAGGMQCRHASERQMYDSIGSKRKALGSSAEVVGVYAAGSVLGNATGFIAKCAVSHVGLGLVGEDLSELVGEGSCSAFVSGFTTDGTQDEKMQAAVGATRDSMLATGVKASVQGCAGTGAASNVIASAISAGLIGDDDWTGGFDAAADAAAMAIAIEVATAVTQRIAGSCAPIPTDVVRETDEHGNLERVGLEFLGGHCASVGIRKRNLHEIISDGRTVTADCHDNGLYARYGACFGLLGVSGHVGVHQQRRLEEGVDGDRRQVDEVMYGCRCSLDIMGIEALDLNSGAIEIHMKHRNQQGDVVAVAHRKLAVFGVDLIDRKTVVQVLTWRECLETGSSVSVWSKSFKSWVPATVVVAHRIALTVTFAVGTDQQTYKLVSRYSDDLRRVSPAVHSNYVDLEPARLPRALVATRALTTGIAAKASRSQSESPVTSTGRALAEMEGPSEVVFSYGGAWDFPLDRKEKTQLLLSMLEQQLASVDAGREDRDNCTEKVFSSSTALVPRMHRSWDIPLSRAEKIDRLTQQLCRIVEEELPH